MRPGPIMPLVLALALALALWLALLSGCRKQERRIVATVRISDAGPVRGPLEPPLPPLGGRPAHRCYRMDECRRACASDARTCLWVADRDRTAWGHAATSGAQRQWYRQACALGDPAGCLRGREPPLLGLSGVVMDSSGIEPGLEARLEAACSAGRGDICRLLLSETPPDSPQNDQRRDYLVRGCRADDIEACRMLADGGTDATTLALLERACRDGDAAACEEVPGQLARALRLYSEECDHGWPPSCVRAASLQDNAVDLTK